MYPRTPQQMVSDTFKSAEHIVGTSSLRELQLLLIVKIIPIKRNTAVNYNLKLC